MEGAVSRAAVIWSDFLCCVVTLFLGEYDKVFESPTIFPAS